MHPSPLPGTTVPARPPATSRPSSSGRSLSTIPCEARAAGYTAKPRFPDLIQLRFLGQIITLATSAKATRTGCPA